MPYENQHTSKMPHMLPQCQVDQTRSPQAELYSAHSTSKHANTRQNTHVSCGTSRQCAASSWAVTKARYGQ